MSSEQLRTGQQSALGTEEVMGVASVCSKRRLENGDGSSDEQESPSSKIPRKDVFTDPYSHSGDTTVHEAASSSEFLTTSILARTLLTGSGSSSSGSSSNCNGINNNHENLILNMPPAAASVSSPLDSLKSSLEAMPAPTFLESLHELGGGRFHGHGTPSIKATIEETTELEFTNLLCHETSLATVTILSPIDEDSTEWRSAMKHKNINGCSPHHILSADQVITEDENGKSYFNLGPSDATILAKKSSSSNFATSDQSWLNANGGEIDLMDDTSSSSSCDSISSEDLFNSCEEFDPSDDEEEVRTYKQERSTVLHLSLCKLNMFRAHCLEPSLRRSVLICNTLRHIEQEIRNEDELKSGNSSCLSLESRETLPPFWPPNSGRNSNHHSHNHHHQHQHRPEESLPVPDMVGANTHDPYLSSNSTAVSAYTNDSPYTSYDYNSLRPSQTPFHAASYDDYAESELGLGLGGNGTGGGPTLTELVSSPPTLLECDSGYAEDLELSSYYYGTAPSPNEFSTILDSGPPTPIGGYCQGQDGVTTAVAPVVVEEMESGCSGSRNGDMGDINCTVTSSGVGVGSEDSSSSGTSSSSSEYLGEEQGNSTTTTVVAAAIEGSDIHCWPELGGVEGVPSVVPQYSTQQEGQCGLESRRSDYGGGYAVSHPQLPMDSLVSANYSSMS